MNPLLSICIPTYNRGPFLPQTLDSITSQWGDDLEITVADNASTDDTQDLVRSYQQRFGAVRYFRWPSNQGADRNYLKCVELASGRYCLILGSDDTLFPGALGEIRKVLQAREPGIVLFNRRTCDQDLAPLRDERFLELGGSPGGIFDFDGPGELERYFHAGRSLCAAFSYLSSVVFEKRLWDGVATDEAFLGSAYIHTQKLLAITRCPGVHLAYLDRSLVNCRLGFDSFRNEGFARRVLLDLEGYDRLVRKYFDEDRPACATAIRRLVRGEYPFGRMLRYQGLAGAEADWPRVLASLRGAYRYPGLRLWLATRLGRIRALVDLSFRFRDWRRRARVRP